MYIKSVLVAGLLALSSMNVFAESVTGVATDWAPFTDPNHAKGGMVVEIAREALAAEGVQLDNKFLPWKRAQEDAKKGDAGIILGLWHTEERAAQYNYGDVVLSNRLVFIKRKGDSFDYQDMTSLTGKKVGTIRGYGYPKKFTEANGFVRQEGPDILSNVKKLVAGRIDVTMDDEIVIKTLLSSQAPELLEKIEFVANPISTEKLYIASGLQHSDNAKIIETFNKGLAKIKSNGKYKEILESYGVKD